MRKPDEVPVPQVDPVTLDAEDEVDQVKHIVVVLNKNMFLVEINYQLLNMGKDCLVYTMII